MHNFYKSQWAASNKNQLSENKVNLLVVKTIQNAHILKLEIGIQRHKPNIFMLCINLVTPVC